jgi:hypothetical protein
MVKHTMRTLYTAYTAVAIAGTLVACHKSNNGGSNDTMSDSGTAVDTVAGHPGVGLGDTVPGGTGSGGTTPGGTGVGTGTGAGMGSGTNGAGTGTSGTMGGTSGSGAGSSGGGH